ncbi:MAG: 6-carboxytetrahydropterin synthase QueD [Fibrobacterales bacterium]
MRIAKSFTFDAAHFLPNVPDGHKCKNLHGHTYKVEIELDGPVDSVTGFVMDFGDLKTVVKPLIDLLDHRFLNDIEGLENSTAENLSIWLWNKLEDDLPLLHCISIWETPTSCCRYLGA